MPSLFKSNKKKSTAERSADADVTIMKLRENIDMQEKREAYLLSRIDKLILEAKLKNAKGDKRGAIFALKKKKLHDAELAKIENIKLTLETQAIGLEGAAQNAQTYDAMKSGTSTMSMLRKAFGIGNVDDLMDDMRDEMDMHREVDDAFSQPIDPLMGAIDDDDLMAELQDLEAEDTRQQTALWPMTPSSRPLKNSGTTTTSQQQAATPKKKVGLFSNF